MEKAEKSLKASFYECGGYMERRMYLHGSSYLMPFLPNWQKNANNCFKNGDAGVFFIKLRLYFAAIKLKCVTEDCIN